MFIDEAEITIEGGNGGPGAISFFPMKNGPDGGNGGRGGDVYIKVDSNLNNLYSYTQKTKYKAQNGSQGDSNRRTGQDGQDLELKVPPGVSIVNVETGHTIELDTEGMRMLICRGGEGGLGNDAFKTSTYQTPKKATPGKEGEKKHVRLVLKLIADYGLIGLPNAGKSSLLNILTAAHVRTAPYPFTTLEPNLGVMNGKVLADIPGLIEGASQGKGLGIKFLKHIEKVSLLIHCISVESADVVKDYQTVIKELSSYNESLMKKKSIILLTKIDLVSEEELKEKLKQLKPFNNQIYPISLYQEETIKKLPELLQ